MVDTEYRVDSELVQRTLSTAVRSGINSNVRTGLRTAAERIALPRAKVSAPSIVEPYLAARATTKRVYITTKGPKVYDRIAGFHEYGGSVTSDITPKKAKAIRIGDTGEIRSVAYRGPFNGKPLKITGTSRIKRGVLAGLPLMVDAAAEEVLGAFT